VPAALTVRLGSILDGGLSEAARHWMSVMRAPSFRTRGSDGDLAQGVEIGTG